MVDMDSAYERINQACAKARIDQACAEAYGILSTLLENDDLPRYAVDLAQAVVDKFKAAQRDMRREAA